MQITQKSQDFLEAESTYWLEQGIISSDQREKILGLYEVKAGRLNQILFMAGIIMLVLGAVSFALAHWHELPKLLRVIMLASGYMGALAGFVFTGRTSRTARLFLLAASIVFGAGIYLITRMYDYKLSFEQILGWWIVQLLTTTMITRDNWELHFTQAVSLVYLVWVNAIDLFALEFMGAARVELSAFLKPVEGFAVLAGLWLTRSRIHDRAAFNVNMLLTVLVLTSRLSLCFGGTWTLIILLITGISLSFTADLDAQILGILLAGLSGLALTWPEFWTGTFSEHSRVLAVMSAVLTAAVMLVNIWRGHITSGVIFCVMLVVRYFFDHLLGYMSKAWGFGVAGIILLAAGIYTELKSSNPESED